MPNMVNYLNYLDGIIILYGSIVNIIGDTNMTI